MFIYLYYNAYGNMMIGLLLLIAGVLLFIYRDAIGSFTGYYVGRGKIVDKPTPGFLLIPFAAVLIIGGFLILFKNLYQMIVNK